MASDSSEKEVCKKEKKQFQQLKADFSKFYVGRDLWKLKFLLFDHLPTEKLEKETTAAILLEELSKSGSENDDEDDGGGDVNSDGDDCDTEPAISSTRVKLLLEIANITRLVNAKKCVKSYHEKIGSYGHFVGDGIKPYRKYFYTAMINAGESEFSDIKAFYEMAEFELNNKWEIVFKIEQKNEIVTREDLISFADKLNERAKQRIVDGLNGLVPTGMKESLKTLVPKNEVEKQSEEKRDKEENRDCEVQKNVQLN